MKMIKMNSIKILSTSLALAGLTLMSCGNDKNKATDNEAETETENVESSYEKSEKAEEVNEIKTRQYAMADGDEFTYRYDNEGAISLNNWNDYNTVTLKMAEIEDADFVVTFEDLNGLEYSILNLSESIPSWLRTEEVMEDIADIQKEYKELIAEQNASESERQENLEELNEQFADLREELAETVEDYMNKNKVEFYNDVE